jgi:hypothetical protein
MMKCETCQPLIESYFDGELDEPESSCVAGHLVACATCARAYRRLEREQDFYLRHENDVEVSPAFWSNVLARTAQESAARSQWNFLPLRARLTQLFGKFRALRLSPLATTAIVLLTVVVTAGVMKQLYLREKAVTNDAQHLASGEPMASPATSQVDKATQPLLVKRTIDESHRKSAARVLAVKHKPTGVLRRPTADELVYEAEQKYLAAIAMLSRDANRRRSQLDAEALAQFDQALAAIDRTIAGTRRVAHARTDDPVAVQYMLAAYARKVDVLRQIVGDH